MGRLVNLPFRGAAVSSAIWSLIGFGLSQAVRLDSTLILTRLLAPQYFGLMALITVFMIGLNMFSDIGVGPHIIQSSSGDDRRFLDTAWTMQVVRGSAIWLLCCVLAWPFSRFYDDPQLFFLLPVVGMNAFLAGLNSTNVFTSMRRMDLRRQTILELVSQIGSAVLMVILAYHWPSIWTLVFGGLFGAIVKMIGTHFYLKGGVNRFCWDAEHVQELFGFGRWIFLSTLFSFAANSASNLILGKFVSMEELGIFSLMITLYKVVEQAYERINSNVLLPAYARIKDLPIDEIRGRVLRIRLGVVAFFVPPLLMMTIFGQQIVDLFFDARYHSGGWVFQLFSASGVFLVAAATGQYYVAQGNSHLAMRMSGARLFFYLLSIVIGWYINGIDGMIVGMALHSVLTYAMELFVQRRYHIWMPKFDAAVILVSALLLWIGLSISGHLHVTHI